MPGGTGGPSTGGPGGQASSGGDQSWRWVFALLILAVIAVVIIPPLLSKPVVKQIEYKPFLSQYVEAHKVQSATVDNNTGIITGKLTDGQSYSVNGPDPSLDNDVTVMKKDIPTVKFLTPQQSGLDQWLPTILILLAFVGIFFWISRRAQGQMSGIMSIGRSRARLYTTERPRTTFAGRGRLPGREGRDQRSGRLPEVATSLPGHRGQDPQGHPARGPARHRQDPPGPSRRR